MSKVYGSCFKQAMLAQAENSFSILVHAIITNPSGKRITHGWLEYTNGFGQVCVYDAQVDIIYPKDTYYEGYKPANIVKYTGEMAQAFALESGTFGPWDYDLVKYMVDQNIPTRNDNPFTRKWKYNLLKNGAKK